MMKNIIERYWPTIAGALVLMIFTLYNGYPVVTGDSAAYLDGAINLRVADDRPIFYGLFVRATSLGFSLWVTAFAQCLLLAYLCIRFIKGIMPTIMNQQVMGILLIISLGTTAGWYAGQIMADIFTPMLFLALYVYLMLRNSKAQNVLLLCIIYICIVVHYSHFMIATVWLAVVIALSLIRKVQWGHLRIKAFQLMALTVFGWVSLFMSNYIGGKGFVTGNASHVFLMGKMTESGVLKTYLDKTCPTKHYNICAYKDSLPHVAWEFIWDQGRSPVFKTGGWAANKQEYNAILRGILSTPRYWPLLGYKSLEAMLREVVVLNIDEGEERPWIKYEDGDALFEMIEHKYPHEIHEFAGSRQNIKILNIVFYDEVYVVVMLLSCLIVLFGLSGDTRRAAAPMYLLLILFLFSNAMISASIANVATRLNSRAIWLLALANVCYACVLCRNWSQKIKTRL